MLSLLIHIIITLLVLGLVWVIVEWALTQIALPPPIPQVVRIIFVIIVLIALLYTVMPLLGVGGAPYFR